MLLLEVGIKLFIVEDESLKLGLMCVEMNILLIDSFTLLLNCDESKLCLYWLENILDSFNLSFIPVMFPKDVIGDLEF